MSNIIQVCLYNTDPDSSTELRDKIGGLNFARLIGESSTPEELAIMLRDMSVNLVFFHLDPDPALVIEVIEQVSTRFPEIAMIALSDQTGPDAILAPIRAGCDQFVCEPIDASDLATAVGRVASKRLLTRTRSRCICVVGASGGAGATTISCNLALEIGHITEKPCALVDLDFQFGDVAVNFDFEPKYTFYDLADTGTQIDRTVLNGVLTQLPCQVHILPRPDKVEQFQAITGDTVHHVIDVLKNVYETVVIDLPRRLDPCTMAALGQADMVLIVCQLLVPSIRNGIRLYETLKQAGVPDERIEIIVNRGDSSGGRISTKDLEDAVRKPIYASIPNDYQFVARSLDFGRPIAALDRNNSIRMAIGKMAKHIIGDQGEVAGKGSRKGSFLSRLLS